VSWLKREQAVLPLNCVERSKKGVKKTSPGRLEDGQKKDAQSGRGRHDGTLVDVTVKKRKTDLSKRQLPSFNARKRTGLLCPGSRNPKPRGIEEKNLKKRT